MTKKRKAMRICILSREYPPETGWGGIGVYTHTLAHGLADRGHVVHVISESLEAERVYADGKVTVHRIMNRPFFHDREEYPEFTNRFEYSRRVSSELRRLHEEYQFDIVEGPNFAAEAYVFSLEKTVPLVTRIHTSFTGIIDMLEWERTMDRALSCRLEDSVVLNSDLVLFSTRGNQKYVFDNMGVRPRNIGIIPLGISLPDSGDGGASQEKVVLFVGRLEKRKGLDVLMRAVPRIVDAMPDVVFHVVGRDTFPSEERVSFEGASVASYKERMLQLLPEWCREKVIFAGYVDDAELEAFYARSTLFVGPSRYESFGLIYVEAMAHGLPVVACRVGGVPEVVADGETGILIPLGDHDACANAIIDLLRDDERCSAMGAAAKKHVESNFLQSQMIDAVETAYRGLCVV